MVLVGICVLFFFCFKDDSNIVVYSIILYDITYSTRIGSSEPLDLSTPKPVNGNGVLSERLHTFIPVKTLTQIPRQMVA